MKLYKSQYSDPGTGTRNDEMCRYQVSEHNAVSALVADVNGSSGMASQIFSRQFNQIAESAGVADRERIYQWAKEVSSELLAAKCPNSAAAFMTVCENQLVWVQWGNCRLYHFYNWRMESRTVEAAAETEGVTKFQPNIAGPENLQAGYHVFLLCSDGFWKYLTDMEIWLDLLKSSNPNSWLTYLRCRAETKKENISENNTAIALWLEV